MNTIKGILGDQIHARMGVSLLIEQKFPRDPSRPEPELLALRGARIAYASEANARQSLDQAKIKDLTGGGFITARGINDKYMTSWKQSALMILLTNYVPKMDTDDDGFNARTLFIEWRSNSSPTRPVNGSGKLTVIWGKSWRPNVLASLRSWCAAAWTCSPTDYASRRRCCALRRPRWRLRTTSGDS